MLSRRDFLQVALATGALTGIGGSYARVAAQQRITQS